MEELYVDMPVTFRIGGDSYAGKIIGFTDSKKTVYYMINKEKVEREAILKDGKYRTPKGVGYLVLGVAINRREPSFLRRLS